MKRTMRGLAGVWTVFALTAVLLVSGCSREPSGQYIPFEKFEQLFRDGKVVNAEEVDRRIAGEYTDDNGSKVAFVTEYGADKDQAVIGLVKGSRVYHRKPTSLATQGGVSAFLTGHFGMAVLVVLVVAGGSYLGHVVFNHRRGRAAGILQAGGPCKACKQPTVAGAAYCHSCGQPVDQGETGGAPPAGA